MWTIITEEFPVLRFVSKNFINEVDGFNAAMNPDVITN